MTKEFIERESAVKALAHDYAYAAASLVSKLPAADVVARVEVEEIQLDNERLRDMWAKAVSDLSKARAELAIKEKSNNVEVKKGEWRNIHRAVVDTTGDCSECGEESVWRTRKKPYALCPNCGAKMDGGSSK